jgi:hypothetical protein
MGVSTAKRDAVHLMFSTIALLAFSSLMVMQNGYSQTAGRADSSGISILSSSSFTDDLGYYHIVGEVKKHFTNRFYELCKDSIYILR